MALQKLHHWYWRKSPVELWLDLLRNSQTYEEWEEAALHLDNLLGLDLWRYSPPSRYYDYRLITERLDTLASAREAGDTALLLNLLRSGLVRNLGNITAPKLYNRSFAGTKYLIEEYITQVAEAIEDIASLPVADGRTTDSGGYHFSPPLARSIEGSSDVKTVTRTSGGPGVHFSQDEPMPTQMKLDFVHDTRQAYGRSSLVLQGGAIFGICHLGVVKALFLRGLLPRVITGTATGALVAALVAIHTEEELPAVLSGESIDLSAFAKTGKFESGEGAQTQSLKTRWETLLRRVKRFWNEGYFLDVKVLEECVRANVGDMTFEEAYNKCKRVLNITVATEGRGGIPTLLNYLTAPNVVSGKQSPSLNSISSLTRSCS